MEYRERNAVVAVSRRDTISILRVVRLDSDVRAELDYAAGLLDGVIEEVGVSRL